MPSIAAIRSSQTAVGLFETRLPPAPTRPWPSTPGSRSPWRPVRVVHLGAGGRRARRRRGGRRCRSAAGARRRSSAAGRWCGGGVVGVVPPLQATPLSVNEVGFGLLPLHDPLKPMLVAAPVARLPFHDSFCAVTLLPDWLHLADQPCATRWLESGNVKPSVQPLSASPTFLMVMLAVKPPCQSLVVYVDVALRRGVRRGHGKRDQTARDQGARAGQRDGPASAGQPSPHIHATDLLGRDRIRVRPGTWPEGRPPWDDRRYQRDSSERPTRTGVGGGATTGLTGRRLGGRPANRMPSTPAYAVWLRSPRAAILAWERFHGNGSIFSEPYRDKSPTTFAAPSRACHPTGAKGRPSRSSSPTEPGIPN